MEALTHPIIQFLGDRLLPGGAKGRLSILMYHRVVVEPDPWRWGTILQDDFDRLMGFVARRFCVLDLDDAVRRLRHGSLPPRSLSITFDDGYLDNLEVALPVLKKHGLRATFFIATGTLDGGLMWNDSVIEAIRQSPRSLLDLAEIDLGRLDLRTQQGRVDACRHCIRSLKYLPHERRKDAVARLLEAAGGEPDLRLMMSRREVVRLSDEGMTIGAHTVTHPILTRLDEQMVEREIRESKQELSSLLGKEISLFAYPNGRPNDDYDATHVALVERCGFRAAVTTSPGVATRSSSLYELPRFSPWGKDPTTFGWRLLMNARQSESAAGR